MKKVKVSIIIPVYNGELYIEKCIHSILKQKFQDYEVILIDDGSTDSSGVICQKMAKEDARIVVIHSVNQGVSEARNLGIQSASGEFLQFIDIDDWIEETMTKSLVEAATHQDIDLVVCGYKRVTKYITRKDRMWDAPGTYRNSDYLVRILEDPTGYYYGVVWNKLFRRQLIIDNALLFDKSLSLGEDFVFNLEYIKHAKNIKVIEERPYIYNYSNIGTLSRYKVDSFDIYKKELENRKEIYYRMCKVFEELNLQISNHRKIVEYWKIFYMKNLYELEYGFQDFTKEQKEQWKKILTEDEAIRQFLNHLSPEDTNQMQIEIVKKRNKDVFKLFIKKIISVIKR